jgi:hypothetical protein
MKIIWIMVKSPGEWTKGEMRGYKGCTKYMRGEMYAKDEH